MVLFLTYTNNVAMFDDDLCKIGAIKLITNKLTNANDHNKYSWARFITRTM